MNLQLNMQLNSKDELAQLITKELKIIPNTTHINELWVVILENTNKRVGITKQQVVEYYLSCCRYDNLKD